MLKVAELDVPLMLQAVVINWVKVGTVEMGWVLGEMVRVELLPQAFTAFTVIVPVVNDAGKVTETALLSVRPTAVMPLLKVQA